MFYFDLKQWNQTQNLLSVIIIICVEGHEFSLNCLDKMKFEAHFIPLEKLFSAPECLCEHFVDVK